MFYGGNEHGKFNVDYVLDSVYLDDGDYNSNGYVSDFTTGKLSHLVSVYNEREHYINNLLSSDEFVSIIDRNVENQILELFVNVRNVLMQEDEYLINTCIESICLGKENVVRFMDEQMDFLDDRVIKVMNLIFEEYSYHIKHLNYAISILRG